MRPVGHVPGSVTQSYVGGAAALGGPRSGDTLASAARGLESTFLSLLLKEMRQALEPEGLFGKDGGDVLGGMFDHFMSQHLMQVGGVGMARALQQQLGKAADERPPTDDLRRA